MAYSFQYIYYNMEPHTQKLHMCYRRIYVNACDRFFEEKSLETIAQRLRLCVQRENGI